MRFSKYLAFLILFALAVNAKSQSVSNPVGLYGWLDQHSLDTYNNFVGNEACVPSSTVNGLTYLQNINPVLYGTNLTGGTNISSTQGTTNSYQNWIRTDQTLINLFGTEPATQTSSGGTSDNNNVKGTKVYLLRQGFYSDISVNQIPLNGYANAVVTLSNAISNTNEAVLGIITYTGTNGGGHCILLNGISWNSSFNTGTLYFVDPLNSSSNYSSQNNYSGTNVLGPVRQNHGCLSINSTNNYLLLNYTQSSNNVNPHIATADLTYVYTLSNSPSTNTNAAWSNLVIGSNSIPLTYSITNGTSVYSNTTIGLETNSSNNQLIVANTNTLLSNSVDLYVGNYGAINSMTITNGGVVAGEYGILGNYSTSSNNLVLVTGTNSVWTNAGDIAVGFDGSGNSLVISNGGKVLGGSDGAGGIIGADQPSSNNSVLVTGFNSSWINSLDLYVGFAGGGNSLMISNGAVVSNQCGYIGTYYQSSNNIVQVTGTRSSWSNAGDLYVGQDGSGNRLMISNSGRVNDANAYIGYNYSITSSNNMVMVTGVNSTWSNMGDLHVGYAGSSNSMVISNGGTVANVNGWIGYSNTASNNSVTVTGFGSLWSNSSAVVVGEYGSGNTLLVSNGAFLNYGAGLYISDQSGASNNKVILFGSNTTATGYEISMGTGINNSLSILNGAKVTNGWDVQLYSSGNSLLVAGPGSTLNSTNGRLYLSIASGGNNSLVVSNGGTALIADSYLGYSTNAPGDRVVVSGAGSLFNSDSLSVGYLGNGASLVVSNGGGVLSGTLYIGQGEDDYVFPPYVHSVYPQNSNNSVAVNGIESYLTNQGDLYVGYYGASNSLIISNGGRVMNLSNAYVGYTNPLIHTPAYSSSNNSVTVTGSNSLWSNAGSVMVGNAGSGNSVIISNGGRVVVSGASNNWFAIGENDGAISNAVTVTGSNSSLDVAGWLEVGWGSNSGNSMVIADGGSVSDSNGYIGYTNGCSNNRVLVTGSNSVWTNADRLYVGYDGNSNNLIISNGGKVLTSYLRTGHDVDSSNNSILVTGGNSLLESGLNGSTNISMRIGANSSYDSLVVNNKGKALSLDSIAIGNGATVGTDAAYNSVLVYGGGIVQAMTNLYVGNQGSFNTLTVSNGGSVSDQTGYIGYDTNASNNSALVTGSNAIWSNSVSLIIGNSGSGNSLAITNGGTVLASNTIIGVSNTSMGNSVLVSGSNSTLSNSGTITIGNLGSGTLTVANGGTLVASQILIGQYGDLDFGRYQQSDSAGSVVGDIVFTATNDANYGINFNQTNTFNLSNNISGPGWICALGTGTTIMSGSNSYSQYTIIDSGTIMAASTNALGTGYLQIGGTSNKATLMLATNLSVADFNWGSNGVVALTAGSQILTVAGMTNQAVTNGGNVFDLQGNASSVSLNNNTNILINFASQSGFTTNSFSVLGIAGYSFGTNNNQISAYLSTSANVGVYTPVTINGTLTVNSLTVNSSGALRGTGTLFLTGGNLTVNGTLAPGNSPGTFYVSGGNLIMGSTAVWDEQIYSNSVYDRVVVTGSAILNGVMNISTFGSGGLQFGQKYNFLTASGGISGAFSSIIAPEGFRGRLLLSGNNTEANILIAPASYTQLAQNQNQVNVATALNSFIPATSGDQLVISTSLDSLTASQYNQAFNAIMPTFYQQMATIAFNEANALNMELNQRLWGVRLAEGGGFSMSGLADNYPMIQEGQGDGSGKGVLDSKKDILRPGLDNHWGMFVDGNGIFAQANSANMLPGYNSESGGITTGLTYKWNDKVASGIYCGYQGTYTKSGANGSGLGTGSSLTDNAVRFGVFGTYGNKDGKGLYLNALAGGAYHNYQATRVIQYTGVNRTANSQPGAGELDTMLATGYDIQRGKFTFGPTASLQYTYLGVNSLNETGAQSLNYNSGGWNSSSMLSSVGAHAAYNWIAHHGSGGDIVVIPQINLNWQHEFMQNPYDISGNLGGTSPTFSNWSAAPIRDFLYTGVGFTVDIGKRWNTSFFYNAAAGNQNLTSQNIFWSAGVKF